MESTGKKLTIGLSIPALMLGIAGIICSVFTGIPHGIACSATAIISAIICLIGSLMMKGRVLMVGSILGFMTISLYIAVLVYLGIYIT